MPLVASLYGDLIGDRLGREIGLVSLFKTRKGDDELRYSEESDK